MECDKSDNWSRNVIASPCRHVVGEEIISIELQLCKGIHSFVYRHTLPRCVLCGDNCMFVLQSFRALQCGDLTQSGHVTSRQNSNNETRERRFELADNTCTIPVRRQANAPLFAVNCKAKLPIKLNRRKVRFSQSFLTSFPSIDFTLTPAG